MVCCICIDGKFFFVLLRNSSHTIPHATAYPCSTGRDFESAKLSNACPAVCPTFKALRIPCSCGSCFTMFALMSMLAATMS